MIKKILAWFRNRNKPKFLPLIEQEIEKYYNHGVIGDHDLTEEDMDEIIRESLEGSARILVYVYALCELEDEMSVEMTHGVTGEVFVLTLKKNDECLVLNSSAN